MKRSLEATAAGTAAATALVAGAGLPGNRFGLAASLVMCGLIATALVVRRGTPLFLVPAALLALAPFVRDAGWVVAPDLVAAVALTAFAAASASDWAAMRAALGRTVARLFPGIPAVLAPLFGWLERDRIRTALPLLRGLALGGILLVVFGALFVSADAAFAEVVNETVPSWSLGDLPQRALVFTIVAALAGALALTAAEPRLVVEQASVRVRLQPVEWIPAIALLDLLFAAFVAVQLAVLFGGHDHVLDTTGLTYAEYARQGFVELIAAAALTLGVAGFVGRHGARHTSTQRRALFILTGILFGLTLVVLASALRRLGLYEEAFGFTRTRLLAHGIILWLGALFVLVAAYSAAGRARDLARASVALTAVALIAATLANPDGLIAARNADRFESTGRVDAGYLADLSADAVPRLAELPPALRACVIGPQSERLRDRDKRAEANLARSRARAALAGLPPASCNR
jgi:MFS family permease